MYNNKYKNYQTSKIQMLNIKKFEKENYVDIYSALTNGGIFSALEDSCVSKMYL